MIDVHISIAAVMAWLGVLAVSGLAAYFVFGLLILGAFHDDRWGWYAVLAAGAVLLGGGWVLSGWAGLR